LIYDVRIYDFKPGTVDQYMAAVREIGLPIRESHGIRLAGWFYGEVGTLNQVIHIWEYADMADFEKKSDAVRKDPRWFGEYVPRVQPLLVAQRNQIMNGPDFFPRPS
jgi:hypothetical protein